MDSRPHQQHSSVLRLISPQIKNSLLAKIELRTRSHTWLTVTVAQNIGFLFDDPDMWLQRITQKERPLAVKIRMVQL